MSITYNILLTQYGSIMDNTSLNQKTEELINSKNISEVFLDNNLISVLNVEKEILYAYGKWDSKDILPFLNEVYNFDDDYREVEDVLFPKESFNPKEDYLPLKYFVKTTVAQQVFRELSSLIRKDNPKIKFLACAKSTGKTISQNIWLKNNDKQLEDRKIFWRRCDCKKLIDLYKNHIQNKIINENSIKRYLDIQFLYILCKHYGSEKRPFFQQIYDDLSEFKFRPRMSGNNKNRTLEKEIPILDEIENIKNSIEEYKKNYKRHYGRDVVIKEAIGKEDEYVKIIDNWSRLSVEIQQKLKDKGYKFLNIIDSIDNYKKYDNQANKTPFYSFILNELKKYTFYNIEKKDNKEFIVILGRKNTFYDYWSELNIAKDRFNLRNEVEATFMDANSIEDKRNIFEKRYTFLQESFPKSKVLETFGTIVNYKIREDSPFYNFLVHDKHIGYLIRNQYNLIPTILYFQEKYKLGKENVLSFLDSQMPVNMLLNGYFSLNTSCRTEEKGQMLFNIFHYEKRLNTDNTWHGLCTTRLLQHLQHKGEIHKDDLINEMNKLFKYNENEIKRKITKLINYSLIKFESEINDDETDSPKILITKKGENTLHFVYSEIDILYHCSLDTPLPRQLKLNSFLQPHENNPNNKNYAISCLKSAVSFIQYLRMKDNEEMTYINSLSLTDIEKSAYALPFYNKKVQEHQNKRMRYLINSLNGVALNEFEFFLNKFNYNVDAKKK